VLDRLRPYVGGDGVTVPEETYVVTAHLWPRDARSRSVIPDIASLIRATLAEANAGRVV
jgi:hypothetical protein